MLYSYQYTYPGKKLLFQGCEFAQHAEWNFRTALDWHLADVPAHRGVMQLVRDLNTLYRSNPELHELDFDAGGFEWVWADDTANSVLSYRRFSRDNSLIVIHNFTPFIGRHVAAPWFNRAEAHRVNYHLWICRKINTTCYSLAAS